jgi:alkylation response protein AidB-like acyl-CoA dehydrogenase
MRRLTDTDGLTEVQREILRTVREFVDAEVLPTATQLDHAETYPDRIVARLKELGVFGLTIGERYRGLGESLLTYALVVEELSRGWMSISGIINTHFIVAYLIATHATDEQKESSRTPCASTAGTATRANTRSSGCTATRPCS